MKAPRPAPDTTGRDLATTNTSLSRNAAAGCALTRVRRDVALSGFTSEFSRAGIPHSPPDAHRSCLLGAGPSQPRPVAAAFEIPDQRLITALPRLIMRMQHFNIGTRGLLQSGMMYHYRLSPCRLHSEGALTATNPKILWGHACCRAQAGSPKGQVGGPRPQNDANCSFRAREHSYSVRDRGRVGPVTV
jgi:hypothetical protein